MTLSELTFKIWEGDPDERFTFTDMNRLNFNANAVAAEAGVTQVTFVEVTHASQFRYDEMQKLEDLISSIASILGVSITEASAWAAGDSLTYADFERVESNLFACYQAIGGIGSRIPSEKFRYIVSATLSPSDWTGSPPHIDLIVPMAYNQAQLFAFVPHTASVGQRVEEQQARLVASVVTDRLVRVTATGIVPKSVLPIRIALGGLRLIEEHSLTTSGWSGSGPWTQTLSLEDTPENAVIGMQSGTTEEQSRAFVSAGIHVSAVSGSTLTVRAIYEKPTVAIPVAILYSTSSVI